MICPPSRSTPTKFTASANVQLNNLDFTFLEFFLRIRHQIQVPRPHRSPTLSTPTRVTRRELTGSRSTGLHVVLNSSFLIRLDSLCLSTLHSLTSYLRLLQTMSTIIILFSLLLVVCAVFIHSLTSIFEQVVGLALVFLAICLLQYLIRTRMS